MSTAVESSTLTWTYGLSLFIPFSGQVVARVDANTAAGLSLSVLGVAILCTTVTHCYRFLCRLSIPFPAACGSDVPTLVFAFARSRAGSAIAITLSGMFGVAFRSSRHVSITRACSLPLLRISDVEQQFLNGWEITVFLDTAATVATSDIKSVRGIWECQLTSITKQ